jgi:uncharacterized protein YcnI
MNPSKLVNKLLALLLASTVITISLGSIASAHVTVKPAEVVTAGFQTFTVSVPNEKDIPTTSVKLVIPEGLAHISPTQKSGWKIAVDKTDATVKSITWQGGTINVDMRDEFTFSAQVPDKATELQWKAYQTYSDGTVVSWDQATDGGHDDTNKNSGPFSVTKVVTETEQTLAIQQAEQVALDARNSASRSMYVAVAGIIIGLVAVYLATRRK